MTDVTTESIGHELQKTAELRSQIKRQNRILILVVLALLFGPVLVTWWLARQYPSISTVSIENMQLRSPAELCPGDALIITYDFHAAGAGVLVRDWTLWDLDPPKTVIFSSARRFILDGPIDQNLTETWHIPRSYLNHETDDMQPLTPGNYKRILAISSPSRSTIVAIDSVEFTVRADCP